MKRREPILIGDLMRQMGIVRADNSVDKDLVCALIYYEQLSEERQRLNHSNSQTLKLLNIMKVEELDEVN